MSELGPDPLPPPVDEPEPVDVERRARWQRAGSLGALLSLLAALLTLIGSFQALFTGSTAIDVRQRLTMTVTGWDMTLIVGGVADPEAELIGPPLVGIPLVVAAVLLLVAAVLGMLVAARWSGTRFDRAGGLTVVVAAAFLAGTVSVVGIHQLWWIDFFSALNLGPEPADRQTRIGPGFWTLVTAVGLAVVAAVVARRPGRPEPAGRGEPEFEREEPETPPLGIPVVVHRLPDEPPDEPPGHQPR